MEHYTRFLQFFYELNIFNSLCSFIFNILAYTVFFIYNTKIQKSEENFNSSLDTHLDLDSSFNKLNKIDSSFNKLDLDSSFNKLNKIDSSFNKLDLDSSFNKLNKIDKIDIDNVNKININNVNKISNSELYNIFITNYKSYILEKYNFSLELVNEQQFNELLEIFNLVNSNNSVNYLEFIINFLATKKENKNIFKNLKKNNVNEMMELLFNNEHFIPNTVLNLFSGNGKISDWLLTYKKNIYHKNIYSYDINEMANNINKINKLASFNKNCVDNIIKGDVIHDDLFKNKYDLVVCDIPDNIKNIIHAECCTLIKQLKIRGTKSEPLIIQLLSQLVSKNGYIICNISNSFLFSDSIQHVQTRKYILDNFNCIQVITKNDDSKKSILLLHNDNTTKEQKIELNSKSIIPNNNSSLYHGHYENPTNVKQFINKIKLSEIIQITNNTNNIDLNIEYLYINKFNNLNIELINKSNKIDNIIISKDTTQFSQEFINIYIKSIIEKNFNIVTKGKMKQIDEELLYNIDVEYPTIEFQKIFLSHYKYSINAIELNYNKINNLENLKKYKIKTNICEECDILSQVCLIDYIHNFNKDTKMIYIHKNSNNAGVVGFAAGEINTNYYYINVNTSHYEEQYIYNILKFNEELLIKYSNENQTVGLARNKLVNILIPKLDRTKQIHLNGLIEQIDIQINKCKSDINYLKDKQFVN